MKRNCEGGIIMFRYDFMIIAFLVCLMLGIAFPLLGAPTIYKIGRASCRERV